MESEARLGKIFNEIIFVLLVIIVLKEREKLKLIILLLFLSVCKGNGWNKGGGS